MKKIWCKNCKKYYPLEGEFLGWKCKCGWVNEDPEPPQGMSKKEKAEHFKEIFEDTIKQIGPNNKEVVVSTLPAGKGRLKEEDGSDV